MNGSPSVRVALFIRESGSESPCRWFYVTGIYTALVNIANVLGVTMDDLLCDNIVKCKPEFEKDIQKLLDDCNEYEIRIVKDMIASLISALRKDAKLRKNTD